ncbi:MAG: hypothetical protein WAS07_07175 [Micropruina sp.]
MNQVMAALDAGWKVLAVGLLLGAGLPTLFALGVRALAWGVAGDAQLTPEGVTSRPHPIGRVIAYVLFGIVLLSVALGIGYIVAHGFGMTLSFNGMMPVFTQK